MGRPKSRNPKSAHIGVATTPEKKRRFQQLGLVGDEVIDVVLYHLEKPNQELRIKKIFLENQLKQIDEEIKNLEYSKLHLQSEIDELSSLIEDKGATIPVESAIRNILQRYNSQIVYGISDWLIHNREFVKSQAFLCGVPFEELEMKVFEES